MKRFFIGIAALVFVGCSTETVLTSRSASAPLFFGVETPAQGEVHFLFSKEVTATSVFFNPPMEADIVQEGQTVAVRFTSPLPGGSLVSADVLVEDARRNTLNVLVQFRTRNDRMPQLVINEIRATYARPRVEFVELRTLSAGNLGGMRLFAAYSGTEPIFVFPPIEVRSGEYIVVHTRSLEPNLIDGPTPHGREFWMSGSLKLHDTNAIYLMDQDSRILDGVLLASSATRWRDSVTVAAEEMVRQGVWPGSDPSYAVNTDGNTATRTINRDQSRPNSRSATDWYITVTSGATPGAANNPGRFSRR